MSSSGMGRGVPSLSYLFSISSAEHGVTQFPRCPNFLILDRLSGLVTCLNHGKVGCFFFIFCLSTDQPGHAKHITWSVCPEEKDKEKEKKEERKKVIYSCTTVCQVSVCLTFYALAKSIHTPICIHYITSCC